MKSPMSGNDTLDNIIKYCQDNKLSTQAGKLYPLCSPIYHRMDIVVVVNRFVFSAYEHSTGCNIRCWIVGGKDVYNIIDTTYWYYSNYIYNESKWESGAWDGALDEAISYLRELVYNHKEAKRIKELELKQKKLDEANALKSRFEALFTDVENTSTSTKEQKSKGTVIKVTTSELYYFQPEHCNGWTIEEVIDNWFNNFPINSYHASRDGNKVDGTKELINIEIID